MSIIANQYICEAESLISSTAYLEYFSYFKTLKKKHIATLYEKAAVIYETNNYANDAADSYIFSAKYYTEINDLNNSAMNRIRAGNCYKKIKDYQKSSTCYLVALEYFEEQKNIDFVISCFNNLAENQFASGNHQESIKYFESCIFANVKRNRDELNFDFYDKLGIIYCTCLKKYAISITIYDKLVKLLIKREDQLSLNVYYFISILLRILANDDIEFAKTYFTKTNKPFLESEYADFAQNILFFVNSDQEIMEKLYNYYRGRVFGLDNINVRLLINSVINRQ